MRIAEILARNEKTFSFEFFPPKTPEGEERLLRTIAELKPLDPSFVSVTYGAGGSTREKTLDISRHIREETGIEVMVHLTCFGHTRRELDGIIDEIRGSGLENIMALRGDPPPGERFVPTEDGFSYAYELVRHIRSRPDCSPSDLSIGVAADPEGHPETPRIDDYMRHLAMKIDEGADFCVTQLFLDNEHYFRFMDLAVAAGITLPIIPGIMPITNFGQIRKFTEMCGATIPEYLASELESVRDDPAEIALRGLSHARRQCKELLVRGVPGLHFFTLNRSPAAREVMESIVRNG